MNMKRLFVGVFASLVAFTALADIAILQGGATSQQLQVRAITQATGAPDTSLVYNTSGLSCSTTRPGSSPASITLATQTINGAWSSGGFVHDTNGWYRLDVPDAAIASGVPSVLVTCAATGITFVDGRVTLSPYVNAGLIGGTAQTGRDLGASVLLSSGTGTGQVSISSGVVQANAVQVGSQTASAAGTVTFPGTIASTTNITAGTVTTATNVTNVSSGAIIEASFATTAGSFAPLGLTRQAVAQAASGATSITLDASAPFANDTNIGGTIWVYGSSAASYWQPCTISDYVASTQVATVACASGYVTPTGTINYKLFGTAVATGGSGASAAEVWAYSDRQLTALDEDATTMDLNATATGAAASVAGAVGSVTGNVGGNVTGSVGSVVGAVGSVTGAVGSVTGAVGSVTGNVGGNVTGSVGTVNALAANVITAAATATDFTTEIQNGLATAAALGTVDTVVDAIKVKTDSLTFTTAGEVDSNAKSMNDTPVIGTGVTGDLFRGDPP